MARTGTTDPPKSSGTPLSAGESSRRAKASRACNACRQLRIRCSGSMPCDNCVINQRSCIIDDSRDKRRTPWRKQSVDELNLARQVFSSMLDKLERGHHLDIARLKATVQSTTPFRDALNELNDSGGGASNISAPPSRPVFQPSPVSSDSNSPFGAGRQPVDAVPQEPPFKLPSAPWTSPDVSADFISARISTSMIWDFLVFYDHALFMRDMLSCELDAPFCSQIFVHALVADSWQFSAHTPQEAGTPVVETLEYFLHRTEDLWNNEPNKCTLPNIQGLTELSRILILSGRDTYGRELLRNAISMFQSLVEQSQTKGIPSKVTTDEWERSLGVTARGLYRYKSVVTLTFFKPLAADWEIAARFWPTNKIDHHPIMPRYPLDNDLEYSHVNCAAEPWMRLTNIMTELTSVYFGDDRQRIQAGISALQEVYSHLRDWHQSLDPCLAFTENCPHLILVMHCSYYWTAIVLYVFIRCREQSDPTGHGAPLGSTNTQQMIIGASSQLCKLLRQAQNSYTLAYMPFLLLQPASVAMLSLLGLLSSSQEARDTFDALTLWFLQQAYRWRLSRDMLRMIHQTARQLQIELPLSAMQRFSYLESFLSAETDYSTQDSEYPNIALAREAGDGYMHAEQLGELLSGMKANHMEENPSYNSLGLPAGGPFDDPTSWVMAASIDEAIDRQDGSIGMPDYR